MMNKQAEVDYRPLAWIAAMALFMQALDATILNTALPAISESLNESPLQMQSTVISYSLTVAALIPLSGWLADRFGTLYTFQSAVLIFSLGSLACAMSSSLDLLVLSRIIQGFGGALMMPVARLAIIRNVPKNQLVAAWNLMAMSGLLGPVLGPVLGGWLVTHATWHWIFLINLPIGALGIFVAAKYMNNDFGEAGALDWLGFFLFAMGLVAITLGLDLVAENLDKYAQSFVLLFGGVCLMLFYVWHAKRATNPLLPLSLWRVRTFSLGMLGNLFLRISGSGIPFLLPLMLQVAFSYDAEMAGFMIAPIALSSILAKSIVAKLLFRFGYKMTLVVTALCMTVSIICMAFLTKETPVWLFVLNVTWYGACMSMMFTAINTLTICDLADNQASAGSTLLSMMQQVGIGFGIALASVILALFRNGLGETSATLEQAFSYTFLVSASFGVVLTLIMASLHKHDGSNLRISSNS